MGEFFLEELNNKGEDIKKSRVTKKLKKLNVLPGKSISAANVQKASGSDVAMTSRGNKETTLAPEGI